LDWRLGHPLRDRWKRVGQILAGLLTALQSSHRGKRTSEKAKKLSRMKGDGGKDIHSGTVGERGSKGKKPAVG